MEIADVIVELHRRFEANGKVACPSPDVVAGWAAGTGLDQSSLLDAIGLHLARGFHDGALEFWFCDAVVNALTGHVVAHEALGADWPLMFWAAYEAFDAGEYSPDPTQDPIQDRTRPLIAKLLGTVN